MMNWIVLFIGGGLGTLSRYGVNLAVIQTFGTKLPYATFVVNVTGCLLIGFLSSFIQNRSLMSPEAWMFLAVGFLGAFTTFSTFILESSTLIKQGQTLMAFANVILSVSAGFLLFFLGVKLGDMF